MSEQEILKLFPEPIFKYKFEKFKSYNDDLADYIYKLQEEDKNGVAKSNKGGWHSRNFKLNDKNSAQYKFALDLQKYILDVFQKFGWKSEGKNILLREMWSIINKKNDFDVAGFCVGAVERDKILKTNSVKKGDCVIGLSSSGIHSNGFSLVRKIIEINSIDIYENPKFDKNKTLAEILMKPTLMYTKAFLAANKNYKVKSISHITGGGLIDNPPRAFNKNLTLKFDMKNFKLPPLFKWLKDKANISLFELAKTFNCGIGFLIFVDKNDAQLIINDINKIGYNAFLIGSMIENNYEKNVIFDGWNF